MIRSVNNKGVEILRKIGIVAMTIAVTLSGCSLFREKENKTIVKWLVPEINLDEEMGIFRVKHGGDQDTELLNRYLKEQKKDYKVELISYPDNASWEEIKEIAEIEKADIVNPGQTVEYNNDPTAYILKAIDEGYCVEVNKEYPQSDALKYKNKLYGFGNVVMTGKNGVSYSERYLEETGAKPEDLEGDLIIEEIKSQVKEYIGEGYIQF